MFAFLPVSVRTYVIRNERLLVIIVSTLGIWLGMTVIGWHFNPMYAMAPSTLLMLYGMRKEAQLLQMSKSSFTPEEHRNNVWRMVIHAAAMILVLVLGVATMFGYTHDKNGIGLLFILGFATLW